MFKNLIMSSGSLHEPNDRRLGQSSVYTIPVKLSLKERTGIIAFEI